MSTCIIVDIPFALIEISPIPPVGFCQADVPAACSAVAAQRFAYAAHSFGHAPRSACPTEHRFFIAGAATSVAKAQLYPTDAAVLPERIQSAVETP